MQQLLVLNLPPELEDDLVDYLISLPQVGGFTSYPARGHGEQKQLSIAEQVTGRRKRIQFELILPQENVAEVLAGIKHQVGGDIFYWQQTVVASGTL